MTLDDIKRLRSQLDTAISIEEAGAMRTMSDAELAHYNARYGTDCAVVGDFVIYWRARFGAASAPPTDAH